MRHTLDLCVNITTCLPKTISLRDPFGWLCPRRIMPWGDEFAARQEEVWEIVSQRQSFFTSAVFRCQLVMEYLEQTL